MSKRAQLISIGIVLVVASFVLGALAVVSSLATAGHGSEPVSVSWLGWGMIASFAIGAILAFVGMLQKR